MITWLASYPKSGNTWARMLLTAYHQNGHLNINDSITTGDVSLMWYQAASLIPISKMTPRDKLLIRYAALVNMIGGAKHRPIVAKTHHANAELLGVRMIPPILTTAAIYIVRDPRDVAPSFARHMGKTIDEAIDAMADEQHSIGQPDEIPHVLSTWSNHVKSWGTAELESELVRYEDMKADPEDALARMLKLCGIKPMARRVRKAARACALEKLKAAEAERGFKEKSQKSEKFFGQGKGWRQELTPAQVARIEADHGEIMLELGYELTTALPAAASA